MTTNNSLPHPIASSSSNGAQPVTQQLVTQQPIPQQPIQQQHDTSTAPVNEYTEALPDQKLSGGSQISPSPSTSTSGSTPTPAPAPAQEQPSVSQVPAPARNQATVMPHIALRLATRVESALPAPARSSMDMSIGDLVANGILVNSDGKAFVPRDVIETLRDGARIEEELRMYDESAGMLARYVLETPALNIFLTLAACNLTSYISHFYTIGLGDEDLPLNNNDDVLGRTATPSFQVLKSGRTVECQQLLPSRWGARDRVEFLGKQWLFMSPVFTKDKFEYVLDKRCPIPILNNNQRIKPKTGLSGSVREIDLHAAHQELFQSPSTRVALKEISPDKYQYFDRERQALAAIRKINNPHLIKPIGSYKYKDEAHGCFLFPWAEGGNLRELWAVEERRPLRDRARMRWGLAQLRGLCDALSALHAGNCRHGDLKPENILLFIEMSPAGVITETLRIADVGLAKIHTVATQQRVDLLQKTGTKTATLRYISPEFVSDSIPRSSDTWALGCVFLEFLIWTLYGNSQLKAFNESGFEQFWVQVEGGQRVTVHDKVQHWIEHMTRDLAGPSGHEETALRSLLDLIRLDMLVPGSSDRSESERIHACLSAICRRADEDPKYALDDGLPDRLSTRPLPSGSAGGSLLLPPQRPDQKVAPPLQRQGTLPNSDIFRVDLVEGPSLSVPNHSASVASQSSHDGLYGTVSALRKLNDVWHSQPNNTFAKALFSRRERPPTVSLPGESRLCKVCARFDLSESRFQMREFTQDILARAHYCQLCDLFSEVIRETSMSTGDMFSCSRINSTLYIENGTQPILSIYADPGDTETSGNAQIGSPLLPEPGSPDQFAIMNEWLNICRGTHNHNYQSPKMKTQVFESMSLLQSELPTRVIDVGDTQHPRLQLIDSEAMSSHEYLAFSHCWGQGPQFSALKSNVHTLRQGDIDMEEALPLPASFRDAIKVARGLTIRYLWIDSLCIIQDDEKDWEHEAARMEQVFSNAVCVIAASSAAGSADGFLSTARPQRSWVTLPARPGVSQRHVCKFIDNFHLDVEEAVLNKRGWVLQERALARRSIHFTTTQLYMECGEGVYCESLMKLTNEKAAFLGDSDFPNSILPKYHKDGKIVLFQNLFRIYSGLSFSYPSDRSRAISGLEKRLMSTFDTRGGYGIFDRYLQRSILWRRPKDARFTPIEYPTGGRTIPSWSWMTYEGPIWYLNMPFDMVDWYHDDFESPFAVSFNTSRIFWEANGPGATPVLKAFKARRLIPDASELGAAHDLVYDLDPKPEQASRFSCIVFGKKKQKQGRETRISSGHNEACNYVLIIEPVSGSGSVEDIGVYKRVGVGSLPDEWIDWATGTHVKVY